MSTDSVAIPRLRRSRNVRNRPVDRTGSSSTRVHTDRTGVTDKIVVASGTGVPALLLWPVLALVSFGVVMVFSASAVYAQSRHGSSTHYLVQHLMAVAVGGVAALWLSRLSPDKVMRRAGPIVLGTAVLMVLVFLPGVGRSAGIASRWIALGPLTFQPAELAKLSLVIFFASFLGSRRATDAGLWSGTRHLRVAALLIVLCAAQPDFGTAIILTLLCFTLMFVSGTRLSSLAMACLAVLPIAYHYVITSPYHLRRIIAFLYPLEDRHGLGYQIAEAFISIGSGGVMGRGLGASRQKLFFLPEAHTDFIFAIIGEELGMIGACAVLGAFVLVVVAGIRIAMRAVTERERFLAMGITALLGLQALINVASATGTIPTKGLPLPFISYGRSSLVVTLAAVGLLFAVARSTAKASNTSESARQQAQDQAAEVVS